MQDGSSNLPASMGRTEDRRRKTGVALAYRMIRRAFLNGAMLAPAVALVLLSSCGDSTGPLGSMQARVTNDDDTALTITIGDTEFGSIAAGATSGYLEIDEGDLDVVIAGVNRGTEFFCDGCKDFAGTSRWSVLFTASGVNGVTLDF
jgi:hypothetical protein